jgi:transcriptional regulator with XRE-family HTH domain
MKIRDARIQKGLSQKQLAIRIGMKQPDISGIEQDIVFERIYFALRIVDR